MSGSKNIYSPASTQGGTSLGPHKTVPLPRSLPELQQAAALHFKTDGRMRLYHVEQDGKELHHPSSVSALKDGDVIAVKVEKGRALGACVSPGLSTHQTDFVQHNGEPAKATMNDATSTLTADTLGRPLEDQSCYAIDFIRYPPTPRRRALGESALYGQHFMKHGGDAMNLSAYKMHFRWPDAKAAMVAGSDDASVLTAASKGHRFTARTSYEDDFARRQFDGPPKPAGNDESSTLTDAVKQKHFEGQSSYSDHFVRHAQTGRQKSARPANSTPPERPFGGSSEYRHQFTESSKRPPLVKLMRVD